MRTCVRVHACVCVCVFVCVCVRACACVREYVRDRVRVRVCDDKKLRIRSRSRSKKALKSDPRGSRQGPGRSKNHRKILPGVPGSSKRPSFEKTDSRVTLFFDVRGAMGAISGPRPGPQNGPKSRLGAKSCSPGRVFRRFLSLLAFFSISASVLHRFWTENQ